MSNMLIEKEKKKREYMEKPFATTRYNVAYDVRVIVMNSISVCYNER
jgi:hypothetical protein